MAFAVLPHIGIVVARPAYIPVNANPQDYLHQILVVSVRQGFEQVTLGTWGNIVRIYTEINCNKSSPPKTGLIITPIPIWPTPKMNKPKPYAEDYNNVLAAPYDDIAWPIYQRQSK